MTPVGAHLRGTARSKSYLGLQRLALTLLLDSVKRDSLCGRNSWWWVEFADSHSQNVLGDEDILGVECSVSLPRRAICTFAN